jgi:hypothetical protein
MPQVRFATARSLFEAFPELSKKSSVAPTDEGSIAFLRRLSADKMLEDAVTFCAHLLPRREAVWWGCLSTRAFHHGDTMPGRTEGLLKAEAWVHEPTDQNRRAALEFGTAGDSSDPLNWLALGAGWSGGMLVSNPKTSVPVPQYMTARAVRTAILLGARQIRPAERSVRIQASIADGIKLAETGL